MIVGGSSWWCSASAHIIDSIAPAAPKQWPVTDFVDEIASRWAWSPKTCLIARVSAASPSGVDVPCALM